MLDIRQIRAEPDVIRAGIERRGEPEALEALSAALELDGRRRALQGEVDETRAERNRAAEEIGRRKKAGEDAGEAMAQNAQLRERTNALEAELRTVDEQLREALLRIPNPPHESVPRGTEETGGEVVRTVGEKPQFGFEPRDHVALAGPLIDLERGARTSGSRFAYLLGDLV